MNTDKAKHLHPVAFFRPGDDISESTVDFRPIPRGDQVKETAAPVTTEHEETDKVFSDLAALLADEARLKAEAAAPAAKQGPAKD